MSGEEDFFSVARTMPLVALMPREVTPWFTALRAYSRHEVSGEHAAGPLRYTYLHQLPTADALADEHSETAIGSYLGEKVVREKEYLSAILTKLRVGQEEQREMGRCLLSHGFNAV